MDKEARKWVKEEKRIFRLLFRTGILLHHGPDTRGQSLDEFYYWQGYRRARIRKRKHGQKYRHAIYLPEIHYSTTDYFGEADEYAIIPRVIDYLYWGSVSKDWEYDSESGAWPPSEFKYRGRKWFIGWLEKQPVINISTKVNRVLKIRNF